MASSSCCCTRPPIDKSTCLRVCCTGECPPNPLFRAPGSCDVCRISCCVDPCIKCPKFPDLPCCPIPVKKKALVISPPICPRKCCVPDPCCPFPDNCCRSEDGPWSEACGCGGGDCCSSCSRFPSQFIRPIRANCCPPLPRLPYRVTCNPPLDPCAPPKCPEYVEKTPSQLTREYHQGLCNNPSCFPKNPCAPCHCICAPLPVPGGDPCYSPTMPCDEPYGCCKPMVVSFRECEKPRKRPIQRDENGQCPPWVTWPEPPKIDKCCTPCCPAQTRHNDICYLKLQSNDPDCAPPRPLECRNECPDRKLTEFLRPNPRPCCKKVIKKPPFCCPCN